MWSFFRTRPVFLFVCWTFLTGADDTEEFAASRRQQCLDSAFPQSRSDFPAFLNCLGLVGSAVEVGVQAGVHARSFLDGWAGRHMRLVDTWGSHEDSSEDELLYVDIANFNDSGDRSQHRNQCEIRLRDVLESGRAEIFNFDSAAAAAKIADGELDFVYLDARHDFVGVSADIHAWWPKVRLGGVFAGHDYLDGEFPEGDFFWRSALREVLPELVNLTHVTNEKNRFPSFFVIKTSDVADSTMRIFAADEFAKRWYAQKSRYFELWKRSGQEDFLHVCRNSCGLDCAERTRSFTPSRTTVSTLRPSCRDLDEHIAAVAPVDAKDVSAVVAPACSAELDVDVKAYHQICLERCNVTCLQRKHLFSAIAENVLLA